LYQEMLILTTLKVESAGVSAADVSLEHKKIRVTVDAQAIAQIKNIDSVKEIEEVVPIKLYNNVSRKDLNGDPATILGTVFEGNGQVVCVADTGFDIGSKTDVHPAFQGRVAELYAVGRPSSKKTNDFNGHGTHCAGSVLGDGTSQSMGGSIKGVAPKAKLVVQSLLTNQGGLSTPANLWNLFEAPYQKNGARVASNSWGPEWGNSQLPYDEEADAVDSFVYNNPDHVIVFAGGNDGEEVSGTKAHIGSSSAAKNCITVGATESSRPNKNYSYDPRSTKPGNPFKIAGFSSLGPTLEKRIKPDVVAPGVAILSASSRDPKITDKHRNQFGPTQDKLWAFSTGTSMATPLVAGCVAVVREALIVGGTAKPSAALVKALLINGAIDLGLPTSAQGFGRVVSHSSSIQTHKKSPGKMNWSHGYCMELYWLI
jgi:serine protease AprX